LQSRPAAGVFAYSRAGYGASTSDVSATIERLDVHELDVRESATLDAP